MATFEERIRASVERVLREFLSGRDAEITDDTDPTDDLDLDSELGIDLAEVIEDEFGISVPKNVNPFKKDRARTRTVGEIVALFLALAKAKEAHHA
jgi:acyl carrier protein